MIFFFFWILLLNRVGGAAWWREGIGQNDSWYQGCQQTRGSSFCCQRGQDWGVQVLIRGIETRRWYKRRRWYPLYAICYPLFIFYSFPLQYCWWFSFRFLIEIAIIVFKLVISDEWLYIVILGWHFVLVGFKIWRKYFQYFVYSLWRKTRNKNSYLIMYYDLRCFKLFGGLDHLLFP